MYTERCIASLSTAGLCGSPRVTDVGGVPYLIPVAQKHKVRACFWTSGIMSLDVQ